MCCECCFDYSSSTPELRPTSIPHGGRSRLWSGRSSNFYTSKRLNRARAAAQVRSAARPSLGFWLWRWPWGQWASICTCADTHRIAVVAKTIQRPRQRQSHQCARTWRQLNVTINNHKCQVLTARQSAAAAALPSHSG